MNRWKIPDWLEREVTARDVHCIYCGVEFATRGHGRRHRPSWEHIINDARIVTIGNIARCCIGCNASKGAKSVRQWLDSTYCQIRGINHRTVAPVVQSALAAGDRSD